jgi:hypothetical protein
LTDAPYANLSPIDFLPLLEQFDRRQTISTKFGKRDLAKIPAGLAGTSFVVCQGSDNPLGEPTRHRVVPRLSPGSVEQHHSRMPSAARWKKQRAG